MIHETGYKIVAHGEMIINYRLFASTVLEAISSFETTHGKLSNFRKTELYKWKKLKEEWCKVKIPRRENGQAINSYR